ncbi:MAG: TIGR04076 family protein [Spirochaetes bacterium]|nr:TIGR04076 family protein [Spirochaetota bacterium]
MTQCKITVLKKLFHQDLAQEYCLKETSACSVFEVGQEYIAKYSMKEPDNFPCSGAWSDISKLVFVLMQGGSFGPSTWGWMKDDKTMISCCSDGVRPVIFKIELIK